MCIENPLLIRKNMICLLSAQKRIAELSSSDILWWIPSPGEYTYISRLLADKSFPVNFYKEAKAQTHFRFNYQEAEQTMQTLTLVEVQKLKL